MRALALAFDEPYDPGVVESAATRLTRRIAVLAYADEEIAGGGMCLEPIGGVVELVGIGVREPFRGARDRRRDHRRARAPGLRDRGRRWRS